MKVYIAKSGKIREKNTHYMYHGNLNPKWKEFEDTVQLFFTDLPDGEYLEDDIEFKTQSLTERNGWVDDVFEGHKFRQFVTAKLKEIPFPHQSIEAFESDMIPRSKVLEVAKYMCGYIDFPERKPGEGVYYWRKILREKLSEIGIELP